MIPNRWYLNELINTQVITFIVNIFNVAPKKERSLLISNETRAKTADTQRQWFSPVFSRVARTPIELVTCEFN